MQTKEQNAKDEATKASKASGSIHRNVPNMRWQMQYRFCSACGEQPTLEDARWRWNGSKWEHECGDPQSGYFLAVPRFFRYQATGHLTMVMSLEDLILNLPGDLALLEPDEQIVITRSGLSVEEVDQLPEFPGF